MDGSDWLVGFFESGGEFDGNEFGIFGVIGVLQACSLESAGFSGSS